VVARLYFDWNATTPPLRAAIEAMLAAYEGAWANPSSVHAEGRAAKARLEDARAEIAALVGARPLDLVLTSGGTEASNLAITSPFDDGQGAMVLAPLEHASVVTLARALARRGVAVHFAKVRPSGEVDVDDVARLVTQAKNLRLVAIQAVNGETGVVQPFEAIAALAHARGAVVHVDAIQAVGRIDAPAGGWLAHSDTVALAAHKIRGPKGIGALATRPGHPLRPLLLGGSQERGLRPGTQDAALAAGFAIAARAAREGLEAYRALATLRDAFERGLLAIGDGRQVAVNGAGVGAAQARRVAHVVNVSFRGWTSPELVAALDLEGLAASGGSACHAGVPEASATLTAMWADHPDEAWRLASPVRFSLPPWTSVEDVERALELVRRVVLRANPAEPA
jgi:cysteine desulfurase